MDIDLHIIGFEPLQVDLCSSLYVIQRSGTCWCNPEELL